MNMKNIEKIKEMIKNAGLRVTPQRIAVLKEVHRLNHPTAEQIVKAIRNENPSISTGTVYKILDTYIEKGLIKRVKTDMDIMRYDGITKHHHHLYSKESDRIEDYYDEELSEIIKRYFIEKNIPGFKIQDFKLDLIGKFENS